MKKYNPTSAGRRNMTVIDYRKVLTSTQNRPHKGLVKGKSSTGGRNSQGRTTTWYRGNGNKKKYREIDFRFDKKDVTARIESIEYDPYRTGFVALVVYQDGERRYILAPKNMKVGDTFVVSESARATLGNRLPLKAIPVGTFVYAVEIKPGAGAKIARSAGNYVEVVAHDGGYTQLRMPSSEVRRVIGTAWATVGEVSNDENRLVNIGKAGRARNMGLRPKTRGTAKNAVDHPHGGGEGKAPIGHAGPMTPWGKPALGYKTRNKKSQSSKFITRRRKTK
ncbi:50S ribosomal protein L2 [Carnobacterium alterfunditum]|uniref:50S ribosomal protein L2 n=1 Tax=Carnobacterium alterfunditum TaxID=28230 RepID=UPI00359406BE